MIGINKISTIPCRAEASDRSEMVSQLLYGEVYDVLEEKDKWIHIKSHTDLYESWIPREQHAEQTFQEERFVLSSFESYITSESNLIIHLSPGSRLTHEEGGALKSLVGGSVDTPFSQLTPPEVLRFAKRFLGVPYLWGGRSKWGIDCSGLIQILMLAQGLSFPRDAAQQALIGSTVEYKNRGEGNLAFFKNTEGKIVHVGMLIDADQIIHASGWTRIDTLDQQGIFKKEINGYSHTLSHIQRITF